MFEAELFQQQTVDFDNIAHGNFGKTGAVRDACFRVDGRGTGRAHATAQDVGTDDKVAVCIDTAAGADHVIPPAAGFSRIVMFARDMGVAGQRMADKHDIVARLVQRPARFVGNIDLPEDFAVVQAKAFGG